MIDEGIHWTSLAHVHVVVDVSVAAVPTTVTQSNTSNSRIVCGSSPTWKHRGYRSLLVTVLSLYFHDWVTVQETGMVMSRDFEGFQKRNPSMYLSPELYRNEGDRGGVQPTLAFPLTKIDIWAMGVVNYQLLTGYCFPGMDRVRPRGNAFALITHQTIQQALANDLQHNRLDQHAFGFLDGLLNPDPNARPNAQQVYMSALEWMNEYSQVERIN